MDAKTRSRTLLLDEDFRWEVLVPYFTLVDLCRRRLEQSLRFLKVAKRPMTSRCNKVVRGMRPGIDLGHLHEHLCGVLIAALRKKNPCELEDEERICLWKDVRPVKRKTGLKGFNGRLWVTGHAMDLGLAG